MSNLATTTTTTHTKKRDRSTRSFGYVGYCHLGTARVWSSSLTQCIDEARDFIQANPKYLTRKGIFVYELGKEKKYINKVT